MHAVHHRLAVALGVWAGVTATPLVLVGAVSGLDAAPIPAAVTALMGSVAAATVVAGVALDRVADPADRLRDGLPASTLIGIPAVELLAAMAALPFVDVAAAAPFAVGGLAGALAGWGVIYVADSVVVRRKRETSEHSVAFSARKAPPPRWKRTVAGLVVLGAVAVAAGLWSSGPVLAVVTPGLLALAWASTLFRGTVRRRYELFDGGFVTWLGHLPWDHFDAFELTDEALVLRGDTWPFRRVAFDRESVDDVDRVVAALERYLPREAPDADGDDSSSGRFRDALDLS